MSKMIEALLIEREGYLRTGKKDRAAAVDKALEDLGFVGDSIEVASVEPQEKAVAKKAVRKRKV
jgi:hypothetical protein